MAIKAKSGGATGFLARLKRAEAGNVLPMMAMAIIPIAGMIGSGLDMSRAYLVKAKLQTACDSTALATRRFMGGASFDSAAAAEGRKFFAFNFPAGLMGTAPFEPVISNPTGTDVVEVRASTSVPTSLMRIFGKEQIAVSVACDADQDFVHNDVMVVLDVTGSMNCTVGTNCAYAATEQPNSRLQALRAAAGALYTALSAADEQVRIRYGFLPYSMTVNVARDLPVNYVRPVGNYWRRISGSYSLGSGTPPTPVTHSAAFWTSFRSDAAADIQRGCLEERSTIGASGASAAFPRITGAVSQADIDSVSVTAANNTTDTLKWNAYAPEAAGGSTGNTRQNEGSTFDNLRAFCPVRARRLAEIDSLDDFNDEVERAVSRVGGYTNHDLGMMWAARYISPTGMFAGGTNGNTQTFDPANTRVDRHIVFMTDGAMTATGANYSAYGMPSFQNRWSTSGTSDADLAAKHRQRFLSACNRARQLGQTGTTIWVVALDVPTGADNIGACANSSAHFFQTNSADQLAEAFSAIGEQIGKLRLTK
jgi:hypothetical protein